MTYGHAFILALLVLFGGYATAFIYVRRSLKRLSFYGALYAPTAIVNGHCYMITNGNGMVVMKSAASLGMTAFVIVAYGMDLLALHMLLTAAARIASPVDANRSSEKLQAMVCTVDRVAILQVGE
jgi:hypothetical protein